MVRKYMTLILFFVVNRYEAFVTLSGRILKVQIDPNVDDGD